MNGGGPLWVFAIGRGIFGAGSSFRVEDVRAIFWKVFAGINRILIFFGGEGWALAYHSMEFGYFPNVSSFPEMLNLKSFGNS